MEGGFLIFWSNQKIIVSISLFVTLIGCSNSHTEFVDQQNLQTVHSTTQQKYDLSALHIELPPSWHLDTTDNRYYVFTDDKGEHRGSISSSKYEADFNFQNVKPNHSSIINDEYIELPLGKCRIITLDADNGTAASGITGTHNTYYAVITIKDKLIIILEFSKNDKESQTKQQFIDILKSISLSSFN